MTQAPLSIDFVFLDSTHCDESANPQNIKMQNCTMLTECVSVRLVGGVDSNSGRLEVHHNGTWGTVCGDYFNDGAARVVCNMLGFGYVYNMSHKESFRAVLSNGPAGPGPRAPKPQGGPNSLDILIFHWLNK